MARQRIIQVVGIAVGLLITGTYARADGWSVSIGAGDGGISARVGVSVGTPCRVPVIVPRHCPLPVRCPPLPPVVVRTPRHWHGDCFDGYSHRRTIVVGHPAPASVVFSPPRVVIPAPCPSGELTVWVVNSNGSQIAVRLTRRSTGYIGPKGEYYHTLPTNEQLRMVYGF